MVLVNNGTASTSELLSGALHDNNRAKLLGTHTFGKGRTQRWRLLQDGSTLLVSSASITTPAHHEIHQVNPKEHALGTSELIVVTLCQCWHHSLHMIAIEHQLWAPFST